jgi:CO/xanthine dehydrogenase FAD-binding subunit
VSLHPQYARPRSLDQAVSLLAGLGSGIALLAGGQELMPHINHARLLPDVIVDLNAIPELTGIRAEDRAVSIGALTVHRAIQDDPLVRERIPLLATAAAEVGGGWQVHNRGTIGGNLAAFHPLYDIAPALLTLDARAEIAAASGRREAPLAALIAETNHGLGSSAILVRIIVPVPPPGSGHAYEKLKSTEGSYGSANAAALLSLDAAQRVRMLRVVLGAASERPIDASTALARLAGRAVDDALLREVERLCSDLVAAPLSDQQGHGAWRRAMAGVVARRAVQAAHRGITANARAA